MVGAVAPTTAGRTDAQVMTADVVRAAVDDGNLAGAIDIHAGGHRALVEHDAVTEAVADGHRLEPGLVDVAGSDHAMTGVIPERAAFDQAASGTDSRRIGGFTHQSELVDVPGLPGSRCTHQEIPADVVFPDRKHSV